ncbi:PAS domain S-box protein [Oleidesulfovibrio sp.]|uniref:PAS domain S-box protein n=1 Tax=Oleidesulfovibrio sp. TaxID=2909707 RepID=UPI003A8B3F06
MQPGTNKRIAFVCLAVLLVSVTASWGTAFLLRLASVPEGGVAFALLPPLSAGVTASLCGFTAWLKCRNTWANQQRDHARISARLAALEENHHHLRRQYAEAERERSSLRKQAASAISDIASRRGEAKFQATFHATPDPILVISLHTGLVLDVNESLQRLLGRDWNHIIGESLDNLLEWQEDARNTFELMLEREGSVSNLPAIMRDGKGVPRHVLISARHVQLEGFSCAIAIARDISTLHRLQEELAGKTSLLENVLSHIPYYVFWKDKENRHLGANDLYARNIFSTSVADIIGKTSSESGNGNALGEPAAEENAQVLSTGRPIINAERLITLHDGRSIIGLVSKVPLLDRKGLPQGVLGIVADITNLRAYERQLRTLLDGLPDMAWIKDANSVYLAVNQAFANFVGRDSLDIPGLTDEDMWPSYAAASARESDEKAINNLADQRYDQLMFNAEGKMMWTDIIKRPIIEHDESGNPMAIGTVGIARDISQRRAQEDRIRMLSEALEQSSVAVAVTDAAGITVHLNPRYEEITGYSPEELIGRPLPLLSDPEESSYIWAALEQGERWRQETQTPRKDGHTRWLSVSVAPVRDNAGQTSNIVLVLEDITEQKRNEDHIRHLAMHDGLTGLPNRRLFMDRLRYAVALNKRNGLRFAVLFIDLNDFKDINDSMGHEAGDQVLCVVAERLQQSLREVDTCARIGGDEFVVLLHNIKSADDLSNASERVAKAITTPIDINGVKRVVSGSIGIAVCPDDATDVDQIINHADHAMYRCKRNRKYDKAKS